MIPQNTKILRTDLSFNTLALIPVVDRHQLDLLTIWSSVQCGACGICAVIFLSWYKWIHFFRTLFRQNPHIETAFIVGLAVSDKENCRNQCGSTTSHNMMASQVRTPVSTLGHISEQMYLNGLFFLDSTEKPLTYEQVCGTARGFIAEWSCCTWSR